MKSFIQIFKEEFYNRAKFHASQKRTKIILAAAILLLLVITPLLTIQKLNEPFEKIAFKLNKPPSLDEVPKEASNSSTLSTTGKIHYPHDYTVVLLGDSMTERLGNSDELKGYLSEKYPNKTFEILNYGYGATNILSVKDRVLNPTDHFRDYAAIKDIDYDLIIIESFANNPLSDYPVAQGLQIQNQAMDEVVSILKQNNPKGKIAFLATIAPNKENYVKTSRDLSEEVRKQWVEERNRYYENHIKYAQDHNIPLINVYKESQDIFGDGKMIYVDDKDFIHPSPLGVIFISQKI